jgi:putative phosphoribosyl transferase
MREPASGIRGGAAGEGGGQQAARFAEAYNRRVSNGVYQDRRDAGRALARAIAEARLPDLNDAIVLGLARGGVPVAFEVAVACRLALDVMIVRKIGVPGNREYAMGAVASGGAVVINPDVARDFHMSEEMLGHEIEAQKQEIERLENLYREGRPPIEFGEGGVILVDDGLATGASMRAAVRAVRPQAKRVTVTIPVGARSTCVELTKEVDHMVCAMMPEPLQAVSLFYRNFEPTSDEEVRWLLAEARQRSA